MGESRDIDSAKDLMLCLIPDEAVDAVARSMYGEAEYDALREDSQAREGYRKRAQALLTIACEAAADARAKAQKDAAAINTKRADRLNAHTEET